MRRLGESQPVGPYQSFVAILALQEFVPEGGLPARRMRRGIADRFEAKSARISSSDEDREGVVKAERRQDRAAGGRIRCGDAREYVRVIPRHRLMEDRSQGRSRVLDVGIDGAGLKCLIGDKRTTEIETAFDPEIGCSLNHLGQQLAEDDLF